MNTKLLATVALAFGLMAGGAYAQQASDSTGQTPTGENSTIGTTTTGAASGTSTTDAQSSQSGAQGTESPTYASEEERMLYEDNRAMMGQFFTDESMATVRSDAEVKAAFEAMGADDQASMKSACEKAAQNRGSYGSVTVGLCQQAGVSM